jgi:hypothetical protein
MFPFPLLLEILLVPLPSAENYLVSSAQVVRLTADDPQGETLRRMLSGLASHIQTLQGELGTGAAAEKKMRTECHGLMRVEGDVRRAQSEMVAEVRVDALLCPQPTRPRPQPNIPHTPTQPQPHRILPHSISSHRTHPPPRPLLDRHSRRHDTDLATALCTGGREGNMLTAKSGPIIA